MSVTLSTPDLTDDAAAAAFFRVADAATSVDGYAPFNEQSLLDLASGRREPRLIHSHDGSVVGASITGRGELDLVVLPDRRGHGLGEAALTVLLANTPAEGDITAWSHGDFPAARALAQRHGFEAIRTLLQLRLESPGTRPRQGTATPDTGVTIKPFHPSADEEEWIALNARVFATHPEQGRLTISDLLARQAESWFDPDDFLIARNQSGDMVGYNWLKVDPVGGVGEIYVLGVSPDAAGQGLGRQLTEAGLDRLQEKGCRAASLYVESDNTAAVALYRSLGFTDYTVDVQYRRAQRLRT